MPAAPPEPRRPPSARLWVVGLALAGVVLVGAVALAFALVAGDEPTRVGSIQRGLEFSGSEDPWRRDFATRSVPLAALAPEARIIAR